jgi:hypothetical protein
MKPSAKTIVTLGLAAGLALGANAQTRSITNGLVVHLTFDETLNDDSGRGNNAGYVSTNGLAVQPAAPTYVPGKLGKAFQFNTYNDGSLIEYASLGYPQDLQFGTTNDFSVAFWINTRSTNIVGGGDPAYFANRNWNSSSSRGYGIFIQGGLTTVRVHYTVTDPSVSKVVSVRPNTPGGESLYDGAWHHIAVACQRGGSTKIYIDGVLESTVVSTATTNTFDTEDLSDNGVPETVNVGQDGTGTYTQGPGNNPPAQPGTAGVTNAAIDDLGIWRRALTGAEVANIFSYAQKGTNLFNVPDVNTPILLSFTPNNGGTGVLPDVPTLAVIQNQSTDLDPGSVRLYVDGVLVTHVLASAGSSNTVTYTSPYLFAPSSTHTNTLIFADKGAIPTFSTNVSVYTVAGWTNLYLGTPLYVENFDELAAPTNPPAVYPAGWSVQNCTDPASGSGTWSLYSATSDAYLNWQIVPIDVIASDFNYDGNILHVNGAIVANGNVIPVLGSNNIAFAASDQRSGNQVDYLFTGDYDLSGHTNNWVAFNSMYSQENYELGALEYSIDQGATWLPIIYMLSSNPSTVVLTNGVVDPDATMNNVDLHIPYGTSCGYGNSYGPFIGVAPSLYGTLGPYIRLCGPSDHVTWHRVEHFPLPMADGQSKVRFRFAFAGANFWDWGFDNFGIYTVPASQPPLRITSIVPSGTNVTVSWNGTGANFSGLQKASSLGATNWVDIPGTIGQTNYMAPISATATYFRARKF